MGGETLEAGSVGALLPLPGLAATILEAGFVGASVPLLDDELTSVVGMSLVAVVVSVSSGNCDEGFPFDSTILAIRGDKIFGVEGLKPVGLVRVGDRKDDTLAGGDENDSFLALTWGDNVLRVAILERMGDWNGAPPPDVAIFGTTLRSVILVGNEVVLMTGGPFCTFFV